MKLFRLFVIFTCFFGAVADTVAIDVTPGFSGNWYDPTHNGEGYLLQIVSDEKAVVYWFTYDEEGRQRWMIGVGEISGSTINFKEMLFPHGGRFGPKFNPSDVSYPVWGSMEMDFSDCANGKAIFKRPDSTVTDELNIQKLTSLWGVDCTGQTNVQPVLNDHFLNPGFSGSWYDSTHNGEGFTVDVISETRAIIYWFTYDTLGNQSWMIGVGDIMGATVLVRNMLRPTGGRFGDDFDPDEVVFNDWGPAVFTFGSCNNAAMRYVPPENFGIESTQNLTHLSPISQVPCSFLTEPQSIIGTLAVAENTYIDGDVNDLNWPETPNDLDNGEPQKIKSPAQVVGYVTHEPTQRVHDRFEKENDDWDTYRVNLKAGEAVELIISDWQISNPGGIDLDLYLINANAVSPGNITLDDLASSSLSTNATEQVVAPVDGDYIVAIGTFAGASNYLLQTGQSAHVQTEAITLAAPMAEGEIIAAINEPSLLQSSGQQQSMTQRINT